MILNAIDNSNGFAYAVRCFEKSDRSPVHTTLARTQAEAISIAEALVSRSSHRWFATVDTNGCIVASRH